MLPFFADTYPDELLYSACARYHRWTGNPNLRDTLTELFGHETAIPSLFFGAALGKLCENIDGKYVPSDLIQFNTLFPLYKPFLPKKRAYEIETQMINSNGRGLVAKVGFLAGNICGKKGISYCPRCVYEDRQIYGESYIHRLHQVQGITICPMHSCMLCQISLFPGTSRIEYMDMERLQPNVSILIQPEEEVKNIQKVLADSAEYLLSHDLNFTDKQSVMLRYKQLLLQKGFLTDTGIVLQHEYISALQKFYSNKIQIYFDSEIFPDNEYTWPKVAVRNVKRTVNPLRHILLIHFLDDNIEAFFDGIKNGDLFVAKSRNKVHPRNDNLLELYKATIIATVNDNKTLSRTQMRKLIEKEYSYIYRRDRQWLMEHLPENIPYKCNVGHVDWYCRDVEYCKKLKEANMACIVDGGRITATRLIRRAGIQANMEKHKEKLPQAWAYLNSINQTVEEYQIERCMNIIRDCISSNETLNKWQLIRRAGLNSERFCNIENSLRQRIIDERGGSYIDWKTS